MFIATTPHPSKLLQRIQEAFQPISRMAFAPQGHSNHFPTWALRNNRLVHLADQWAESGPCFVFFAGFFPFAIFA